MLNEICKGEKNVYWKRVSLKQRFTQGIQKLLKWNAKSIYICMVALFQREGPQVHKLLRGL